MQQVSERLAAIVGKDRLIFERDVRTCTQTDKEVTLITKVPTYVSNVCM